MRERVRKREREERELIKKRMKMSQKIGRVRKSFILEREV